MAKASMQAGWEKVGPDKNGILRVTTGYSPRVLQAVLHRELKRFNVIVCHRRFGKTVFCINEMVDKALYCNLKNPQYAYIAPTYGQAKRVAWDILKDAVKNIPGAVANEAELRVDIPRPDKGDRIRFMLLGAENPGSIRGIYLDGVIMDEMGEMDPIVWSQVVRPALSDRLGWAVFIGTPKGQNGFYDLYQTALSHPDWYAKMYKASETGIIPLGELEAAKAIMSPEEYDQEYECSFSAALVGAYYGKYMAEAEADGRICDVPHDPAVPVDTFWDLGVDDTTVVWFGQRVGKRLQWIDYIEMSGEGLDYYVKELQKKKYLYGEHYLPHDAEARELGTGKTRTETLTSLGLKNINIVPRQSVEDGINASRMIIPKSWFDKTKCKRGIEALKSYERKWDSKNKIYQQRPLHNWASHGADAFRTAAMGLDDRRPTKQQLKSYPRRADTNYDIFGG
jgi:phage terminase large subunit